MEKRKQNKPQLREIISYLFWGGMTTVVSWGSYSAFILIFRSVELSTGQDTAGTVRMVFTANVLSWICAVAFAFFTNKLFVFRSREWKREVVLPELFKFLGSRAATGILEVAAVPLLVRAGMNHRILGIEGMDSKVLVSVIIVILNYVFSKRFVFGFRR